MEEIKLLNQEILIIINFVLFNLFHFIFVNLEMINQTSKGYIKNFEKQPDSPPHMTDPIGELLFDIILFHILAKQLYDKNCKPVNGAV